jgi:hypothetical protein
MNLRPGVAISFAFAFVDAPNVAAERKVPSFSRIAPRERRWDLGCA